MSNYLPEISKAQLENSSNLPQLAKHQAEIILSKIQECSDEILAADMAAINAKNLKKKFFQNNKTFTDRKTAAIADAQLITNSAVHKQNELIQEAIKFTRYGIEFSRCLGESISFALAQGFIDVNGKTVRLAESSKKQANLILEQANAFIDNVQKSEEDKLELQNKISSNKSEIENITKSIEEIKSDFAKKIAASETKVNDLYDASKKILALKLSVCSLILSIVAIIISTVLFILR